MKKYRKNNVAASKAATKAQKKLKKQINRSRSRAKWVGLLYLLGIIAMAATFVLSVMNGVGFNGIADGFSKLSDDLVAFIVSVLYALVALVIVVNVFKALGKLGWLFKKKATLEEGFNRSAYAMNDLSGLFTGTATFTFVNYLIITVLTYTAEMGGFLDILMADMMMLAFVGVAVAIGILADALAGRVRYYDIEGGAIIEEQHLVGRFAGFIRKILRNVAVLGIAYGLSFEVLNGAIVPMLDGTMPDFSDLSLVATLVAFVVLMPLIKRAFRANDYTLNGVGGDKGFAFFAFLAVVAGGILVWQGGLFENVSENMNNIIIAGVSLVAFLFELILRGSFKLADEVAEAKKEKEEQKAEKKAEKKAAKKEKKQAKKTGKKTGKKGEAAEVPANWDENEFDFDTLMRAGNVTVINTAPAKK